ncbi:hypothetical protein MASR2M48_21670 [Spirochaetota bacterium]
MPELVARARCVDDSPVNPEPPNTAPSVRRRCWSSDTIDPELLRLRLGALVRDLAFLLRKEGRGFHRIEVGLSYADGLVSLGSACSRQALHHDGEALQLALEAMQRARTRRVRVRMIRLSMTGIVAAGPELDLFEPDDTRITRLQYSLGTIRGRYGSASIEPCSMLTLAGSA